MLVPCLFLVVPVTFFVLCAGGCLLLLFYVWAVAVSSSTQPTSVDPASCHLLVFLSELVPALQHRYSALPPLLSRRHWLKCLEK